METAIVWQSEIKASIAEMKVGQTKYFPIEKFAVVRVYANEVGLKCDMVFKTHTNRQTRKIEVTRTA